MVAAVLSGLQRCFLGLLSAQGLSLPGVFLGSSRLGSFLRHSLLCLFLSRRSLWLCFNRSRGRTGLLSPSILWLSVGSALGLLFFSSLAFGCFFICWLGFSATSLGLWWNSFGSLFNSSLQRLRGSLGLGQEHGCMQRKVCATTPMPIFPSCAIFLICSSPSSCRPQNLAHTRHMVTILLLLHPNIRAENPMQEAQAQSAVQQFKATMCRRCVGLRVVHGIFVFIVRLAVHKLNKFGYLRSSIRGRSMD